VDYATNTAEVRTIALPDGSAVDLAPESRIRIAYSEEARRIELAAGEAFFEVAKDEERPFIVSANGSEVRAVGTKFNVHRGPAGVTVAVAEGEVDVRQKAPLAVKLAEIVTGPVEAPEQRLKTGELLTAASNLKPGEIIEVSPQRAGAWRTGHLFYPDNSLREVIADVNRYSRLPVSLASEDLGDLRIAAAFPTTQIDEMLGGIEGVLPVTVDRSNKGRIVIRASGS
jgi:transmembrane sensor